MVVERRIHYLATFLLEQKIIQNEVNVDETLDVSVSTEALKTWKRGQ
ncbi:MAG: hypothetical protein ACLPX5_14585 [Dissulfurispiraceae bacterium]